MRFVAYRAIPVLLAGFLVSCSSTQEPTGPKPGSPEFYWLKANDSYKRGDFAQTADQLSRVAGTANPNQNAAKAWLIALSAGLAKGDMEYAGIMDEGGKAARTGQLDFRKQVSDARAIANQHAMRVLELSHQFVDQFKDADLALAPGLPKVSADKPPEVARLTKGQMMPEADINKFRTSMQKRGAMLEMARLAGAGTDMAKAEAALSNAGNKIPKATVMMTVATELTDLADLYGPKKLDQSGRGKMFCEQAKEALAQVPASADTKALSKKIEEILKKLPK